ncbi:Arabinogalactan endo-1,4-beta-galactosidase precursor [Botrimarina colliarenosi]|uniref:Arabinogalactan endo-beta-1,4-galactanase n=1 Tax=Botrimarina colliarenosi TaxID=2528001 RepID=A0A5C5ZZW7_9BACT|nr:glycosyl hydrolase 53 family protein [Botrimarina colliarenosi]TWT92849.1 Arabinogalactan endo-1,4-beta-galactosidase precursor [Botrimarina colliarenosi]
MLLLTIGCWLIAGAVIAEQGTAAINEVDQLGFAIGADVSFLAHAESQGAVFKDGGVAAAGLEILKDHGYNWVRLRLFHTPDHLPNDLAYTIEQARRAKSLGMKVLLDFHYSDTWADPGKQFLPKAWRHKSHDELVAAVREHTRLSVAAMRAADAGPDMVQIGNEVIAGMLWPDGKLPERWPQFADLFRAGVAGVHDAGGADSPLIMMHIDRGGDREATEHFFKRCHDYDIRFDVIGQSYYPWWHGGLDGLRTNLAFMAETFKKPIIVVEAAYNWRRAEYPDGDGPFPESPAGQRAFLEEVAEAVRATPGGLGRGVFWWEPAVPKGPIYSRGMFDDDGDALPVLTVFDADRIVEESLPSKNPVARRVQPPLPADCAGQ